MKLVDSGEADTKSFDEAAKLDCLNKLLSSPVSAWPQFKLLDTLEKYLSQIHRDKSLYASIRRVFVTCNLLLNRKRGPAPVLRRTIKVPPLHVHPDGYPRWAIEASNDKQLIDLDYFMINYPEFVQLDRDKYQFLDASGSYNIEIVQDFVWDIGFIKHKLGSLNLPDFLMFFSQSLRNGAFREHVKRIDRACLLYEQSLLRKMSTDKRCRLNKDAVALRVRLFRCIQMSCITGSTKNADVMFYFEGLTGTTINAGTVSRLVKSVKTDCTSAGINFNGDEQV